MDLRAFSELISDSGQAALQAAVALQPREEDFLRHHSHLSKTYPADLARAALEVAVLRLAAREKFPFAERMYFARQALEQATSFDVSSYRAKRFAGYAPLFDLGCSIGGDTIALAGLAPVVGVDLDTLRLAIARANLDALDLGEKVSLVLADLARPLPFRLPKNCGLFFDPARRTGERRVFSVSQYRPPLSIVHRWVERHPALGVKISPGVRLDEVRSLDAEVEFISSQGELKEAVLWFGPLKTALRRATLLPGPHTLSSDLESGAPGAGPQLLPISEPQNYLYEPDPAVLRAGLVQALGAQLGAAQLDRDIAYLTAERRSETPFARAWEVEFWMPFGIKRLRLALRQRGIRRVVVKKRGSPLQPEQLIRALRLKGESGDSDSERVLVLTHLSGRPIVIVCLP